MSLDSQANFSQTVGHPVFLYLLEMPVAKISIQVEGRLTDLITQSPHALVVSHRSALFVFLCLLWPFPAKIPLPHFANASNKSNSGAADRSYSSNSTTSPTLHPAGRGPIKRKKRSTKGSATVAGGGRPARRQTGVSQRGQDILKSGFQRSRPPDNPHLTIARRIPPTSPSGRPPGSAGVPPACCPFGCRSVSLRCCSRPPCRREPHGPGRSRGRAPLPVDSGGGDGRSCGRICAGGTPALPGGLPPMTGSHQRDKSAEAFWRQLSLKEVHQSWCLFVFIGGSSSLTNGCFSSE